MNEDWKARAEAAESRVAELEQYAREATKTITEITGGGSECFLGKIGEMYKADLRYCHERIRERESTGHERLMKAITNVSHWREECGKKAAIAEAAEARAKELERERNSYDDACVRAVYRAEAAEDRATALELERDELRQSNIVLGQSVKEEYDRAKAMFEARVAELERERDAAFADAKHDQEAAASSERIGMEWQARATALAAEVERLLDGSRPLPFDRDQLGRFVREAWVRWAEAQPNPKPTWLEPYDALPEPDREADRQIGEAVARWTLIGDASRAAPPAGDDQ